MFLEQGTPSPQGCSVYFVVATQTSCIGFIDRRALKSSNHQPIGPTGCAITRSEIPTATVSLLATTRSAGPPSNIERVDFAMVVEQRAAQHRFAADGGRS